jgi:methionyl aminopeptidase
MSKSKTPGEIDAMRAACRVAAQVLDEVSRGIEPGVTTAEIDGYAAEVIARYGAKSAFLGYRKFPCHTCISVNEEVVHGMGGKRRLVFGDIVSLDVGVVFGGWIGDNARTVAVGGCSVEAQRLMDVTERSLEEGIRAAIVGNRVADISRAIQSCVEGSGYSVVREFVGHGVGRSMHEEPQIPNYVDGKSSPRLREGMTLAIEPMVNAGRASVEILSDGWTVVTRDRSLSSHFEHTVLVSESGPEILTCLPMNG